jgi:hypothetical protein
MNIGALEKLYASAPTQAANLRTNNSSSAAGKTAHAAGSDKVSISSEGKTMSKLAVNRGAEGLLGIPPGTPGATLQDKMANAGNTAMRGFYADFRKLLADNGISSSTPVELDTGYDGRIIVTNNNPDKAAIEKILKDNPDVGEEYRMADNMLTLAAEVKESLAFQKAYAADPETALRQYGYLFYTKAHGKILISDNGAVFEYSRLISGKS